MSNPQAIDWSEIINVVIFLMFMFGILMASCARRVLERETRIKDQINHVYGG